mmetsp:Transcript_5562/g.7236  ORF Transcript_5562/g.7236 Transcript_5562/m.7236 type:complete len:179 (+) Transcript_5562:174-710(+)
MFFVVELIVGPYLVAKVFGEEEPIGLVFPYGIVAIDEFDGIVFDSQTYFLALFAQIFAVFPFLIFATIMFQDREGKETTVFSVRLSLENLLKALSTTKPCTASTFSRRFAEGLLPLMFVLLFVGVIVVMLSSYYLSVIPLFFSPGIWFLSGNVVWSIYLLGTMKKDDDEGKMQNDASP